MRYSYKKTYKWSPDLAYCVGLIVTDGSLSKDGRHIDLTSADVDLLETFTTILGIKTRITPKMNGTGGIAYRVQFSNVAFYDFLLNIGVTPNKSKSVGGILIEDRYYADFLRGCVDGDGTYYGYRDTRWKSSYMYYLQLVSASKIFIDWIANTNSRLVQVSSITPRFSSRVWIASYAKSDTDKLVDYMYYGSNVPRLKRKYEKIIALKQNPQIK